MPDVVISGATGFIGAHLMTALQAAGLDVATYADFRDRDDSATTFIHCANNPDNAAENAVYTADVLTTVAPRVKRFINFQTFATLHGVGALDATAVNFGKTPLLLAPYPFGKLIQERTLLREAARHSALSLHLIYLPAVLGGGSWGHVLARARQNGVVLPPMMSAKARANAIEVAAIAQHIIDHIRDTAPRIRRTILNDPASAVATWPVFFSDAASVAHDTSPKSIAKLAATGGALAAYGLLKRIRPLTIRPGEIDRRAPRPRTAHSDGVAPSGPAHFTGLVQHIVRTQPYIPPSA